MKKIFEFIILSLFLLSLFATNIRCRNILANYIFLLSTGEYLEVSGVGSELNSKYEKYDAKNESTLFTDPILIKTLITHGNKTTEYDKCIDVSNDKSYLEIVNTHSDGSRETMTKILDSEINLIIENKDDFKKFIDDNISSASLSDINPIYSKEPPESVKLEKHKLILEGAIAPKVPKSSGDGSNSIDKTKPVLPTLKIHEYKVKDGITSIDKAKPVASITKIHGYKTIKHKRGTSVSSFETTPYDLHANDNCLLLKKGIYPLNDDKNIKIKIISIKPKKQFEGYIVSGFLIYDDFFNIPIFRCNEDHNNLIFTLSRNLPYYRIELGDFSQTYPIDFKVSKTKFIDSNHTNEDLYPELNYKGNYYNIGCHVLFTRFEQGKYNSVLKDNSIIKIDNIDINKEKIPVVSKYMINGTIMIHSKKYYIEDCKRRYTEGGDDSIISYYEKESSKENLLYSFNVLDFLPSSESMSISSE